MTAIEKMMIDLDPETMMRQVMSDPNHQARVRARSERERKAHLTETEKALQAEKAGRKKDRRRFQEQVTRTLLERDATAAAVAVFALVAGYLLALM